MIQDSVKQSKLSFAGRQGSHLSADSGQDRLRFPPPFPNRATKASPRGPLIGGDAEGRVTDISTLPQELMTAPGSAVEPAS